MFRFAPLAVAVVVMALTACGDAEHEVAATDYFTINCNGVSCHGAASYNMTSDSLRVDCEWACASIYPDNDEMKNAVAQMVFTRPNTSTCFQVDAEISPVELTKICTPN